MHFGDNGIEGQLLAHWKRDKCAFFINFMVCLVKRQLHDKILLGVDKNVGKTAVLCQRGYYKILDRAFIQDTEHYQHSKNGVTRDIIFQTWKFL
jgi:hypothetical protein